MARALIELGRDEEAIELFRDILAADPGDESSVLDQSAALYRLRKYEQARDSLERVYRRFPDRGLTAHALARLLAACPDVSLRDGQQALDLALRVHTARQDLAHAETVALALAETGRCDEAADWQRRLVEAARKAGNSELASRLVESLARYESGNPCRPPGVGGESQPPSNRP